MNNRQTPRRVLVVHYLGRRAYEPTWALQERIAERLRHNLPGAAEVLLAVEHTPVITIGRRGRVADVLLPVETLARRGVEVVQVDRGGEVTYHGPGQLVVYPIVRVGGSGFGVGDLVRGLAGAVASVLAELGVVAVYDVENPGLWVEGRKICAVGMRVARGVSTHGAALNVTTDLSAFGMIVPCGMRDAAVTSLAERLDCQPPRLDALAERVAEAFAGRFSLEWRRARADEVAEWGIEEQPGPREEE